MIIYSVYVNNTPQGTIQAASRIEAVRLANEVHKECAGIHVSKESEWTTVSGQSR